MEDFNELLIMAKQNKKKRAHEDKEVSYCKLNANESYPAFIVDAEYNKDESSIELNLAIIKGSSCSEKNFKFKIFNGSSIQYDAFCETLGTEGNLSDLIGKCFYMHIERNDKYQNLCAEAEMDRSEFEELISDINKKSTKVKKTTKSKKISYVKPHSFKDDITNEDEDDDEEEEEFLDDEEEEE